MVRRYGLRDDQWEKIERLLPGQEGHVGGSARDNRLFVEAVLYRCRAGIPWRDLPERFGDFRVIHTRHTRWSKSGVWQQVFDRLADDPDNKYAMIDSTIRPCPSAQCRCKGGIRCKRQSGGAKAD
jgi:transposase